ncbi:MAG: GNAT family N-acetyltransferase [Bacteroidota bacterium]
MEKTYQVVQNTEKKRFEIELDGKFAFTEYTTTPKGMIVYTHTEVPQEMEGKGIGSTLAKHVLDYARQEKMTVLPLCPFVAGYIRRHPEYADLVLEGFKY